MTLGAWWTARLTDEPDEAQRRAADAFHGFLLFLISGLVMATTPFWGLALMRPGQEMFPTMVLIQALWFLGIVQLAAAFLLFVRASSLRVWSRTLALTDEV